MSNLTADNLKWLRIAFKAMSIDLSGRVTIGEPRQYWCPECNKLIGGYEVCPHLLSMVEEAENV